MSFIHSIVSLVAPGLAVFVAPTHKEREANMQLYKELMRGEENKVTLITGSGEIKYHMGGDPEKR